MNEKTDLDRPGKLNVFKDENSIFVKGETFKYGFDKRSGLINCLKILGEDFLQGMDSEIPDIYVSDAINPREAFYAAKYEDTAECEIISASPYEVHIRTHGVYHNSSGDSFPVRYRITYEIQNDGTIFVIVDNKAYEPCVIRWLCISRGILNPSLCKYFSYLADQSKTDTTENFTLDEVPAGKSEDQTLFSGRLIPWFWFGNNMTGVEVAIWDATNHRYGATMIANRSVDPLGEVGGNISAIRRADDVLWEIFSLRNIQTPVSAGWEQPNYFAMSITPPKVYNPRFAGLRAYRAGSRYLSDNEFMELYRKGVNLIIGGVKWRSGEYVPEDESETQRVISFCHEHDIKVIPEISLMDLDKDTEIFREFGSEWRIEPVVEYESGTNLMCPGAEAWRAYWKDQVSRIIDNYDASFLKGFDGLYIDFQYDKLTCRNPRHGCQKRYMRPSFIWVREMLRHAYIKAKSKSPGSIVIANTDLTPISMFCNWLDVRAVGKSQDIRTFDMMAGWTFYSSYRLGCNSLLHLNQIEKIDHHLISSSLLYMAPLILDDKRSQQEADLIKQYWDIFRYFNISKAEWYPGFTSGKKLVSASNPDLYINVHKHNEILLTLVNTSPDDIDSDISILDMAELGLHEGKEYLIYEPIGQKLFGDKSAWTCADLKKFTIRIQGYSSRLLYICERPQTPRLLFAMGRDGSSLRGVWDEDSHELSFLLFAPFGAYVAVTVYFPSGMPSKVASKNEQKQFSWDESQKLAFFDIYMSDTLIPVKIQVSK